MIDAEMIVAEARRWIGTPYRHQASRYGAGTDCLGLIRGVWRSLIGREPETVPAYSTDWSEVTGEEALLSAANRWLIASTAPIILPGQVIVFRMCKGAVAKHMGIAAEIGQQPTFIHAYTDHGVVESYLSQPWHRKIAGRFDFPKGT